MSSFCRLLLTFLLLFTFGATSAFTYSLSRSVRGTQHGSPKNNKRSPRVPSKVAVLRGLQTDEDASKCWNPDLRKNLSIISSVGLLETSYLTYDKLQFNINGQSTSLIGTLCNADSGGASSCNDVLHGQYSVATVGGVGIPLSLIGMAAYLFVLVLSSFPLWQQNEHSDEIILDSENRISLLGGTTLMATFSIYLVSLLIGVLHASCLFCFMSAGLSITMAGLSWFGGMLPRDDESEEPEVVQLRKKGVAVGALSVGAATVAALGLFLTVAGPDSTLAATTSTSSSSGTLLASTSKTGIRDNIPPPITEKSSKKAMALASDLKSLDAKMFGAFWCSHCIDQKQSLGYEAMQTVPYVECDREGYNNKRDICLEREVPGYPTWEINGELFPGEKSLDELREIVNDILKDPLKS